MTDSRLHAITQRIIERSRDSRAQYLEKIAGMRDQGPQRGKLSCSNLAHGFAACNEQDKQTLTLTEAVPLGEAPIPSHRVSKETIRVVVFHCRPHETQVPHM